MASHTEPAHRHSKEELLKPGTEQHTSQQPPCPDPSVHRNTKLQEQASTAALYVTNPARGTNPREGILDKDNKLSSRSAAMSLKYASPQELPSFPVVGINTTGSANQAANLANTNQKAFEYWKPDPSAAAGKAALLAKDYKMDPLWQPQMSAAGSKAALLAHKNDGLSPQLDYGYTEDGHKRALMAATGALDRSKSNANAPPVVKNPAYPDSANSAHNALNAASVAHRPSTRQVETDSSRIGSKAMQAARVQNYAQNVPREMFGEHPPVAIEVEEKKRQEALHASAVTMAKQMYNVEEKRRRDNEASAAATMSHARGPPVSAPVADPKAQAMQYIHLQEAAQRLAKERLDKMDPDGVARYRAHYGYEVEQPRSRISMRGRQRKRAESDTMKTTTKKATADDDSSDDEMQARRIRNQMSGLNNSLAHADAKKQKSDRAALLAAAEKKVQAQMHSMDEKVFQETGKVSPAMMEEWEAKARAKATADSEVRQKNYGKVNIGGGRYMDQSELEAIALARLQPTLDEISATAEKKRARDEELRLEREELKRQQMAEKERERGVKAEQKRKIGEEKTAVRTEKDAEKARKAEAKRAAQEDKLRTKAANKEAAAAVAAAKRKTAAPPEQTVTADTQVSEETRPSAEVESAEITRIDTNDTGIVDEDETKTGTKSDRRVSTTLTSDSESEVSNLSDERIGDAELARRIAERATGTPYVTNKDNRDNVIETEADWSPKPVVTSERVDDSEHVAASESITASEPRATLESVDIVEETPAAAESVDGLLFVKEPVSKSVDTTEHVTTTEPVSKPTATTEPAAESIAAPEPVSASKSVVSPEPVAAKAAPASSTPTKAAPDVEFPSGKRRSRGLSGLFGKFRKSSKAAETQPPSFEKRSGEKVTVPSQSTSGATGATTGTATGAATDSTTGASSSAATGAAIGATTGAAIGATAAAAAATTTSTAAAGAPVIDDAVSESSFRRHDTDLHSISSALSSDEEDAPRRGRSGKASTEVGDEEEEFEEARDHFDESLAPPPSFGGQAKSASPVRETKFQEVL